MTNLIQINDLVIDEETGEIVEWPTAAGGDTASRIAYLINLQRSAAEAAEAFETAKRVYGFVIGQQLGEAGVKSLDTQYGKATRIADGETKVADPAKVAEAVAAELITHSEAESLLLTAAKALDASVVAAWLDTQPEARRLVLRAVLITLRKRAGYVRITPPTAKPPRIERLRRADGDLAEELEQSIAKQEAVA